MCAVPYLKFFFGKYMCPLIRKSIMLCVFFSNVDSGGRDQETSLKGVGRIMNFVSRHCHLELIVLSAVLIRLRVPFPAGI